MDTVQTIITNPRRAGKSAARKALIIALTGRPDVGKDTVASILAPGHGFARIAFADALRSEICEAWRIDLRMLTDRATKELPIPALAAGMCSEPAFLHWCINGEESLAAPRSPRWVMQNWATFQRRTEPDRYARITARWIERHIGVGWNRIVVSDLRDPIEEAALRALGAKVVRVHRMDARPLEGDTALHASEQHHRIVADADIVNEGSLPALAEATVECADALEGFEQVT
jgi:hypothetical protein